MYEQINFTLIWLLVHFQRSMSANKVSSKPRNSFIAPSRIYAILWDAYLLSLGLFIKCKFWVIWNIRFLPLKSIIQTNGWKNKIFVLIYVLQTNYWIGLHSFQTWMTIFPHWLPFFANSMLKPFLETMQIVHTVVFQLSAKINL